MSVEETESILIIHTSCRDDAESSDLDGPPVLDPVVTPNSMPVVCNILILPEFPMKPAPVSWRSLSRLRSLFVGTKDDDASSTLHDAIREYAEYPETLLNPCGISNVLTLQNLPWKNVLLSLSSCYAVLEGETTSSGRSRNLTALPAVVDPIPATHAFAFEYAPAGNAPWAAELYVDFNVTLEYESIGETVPTPPPDILSSSEAVVVPSNILHEAMDLFTTHDWFDFDQKMMPTALEADMLPTYEIVPTADSPLSSDNEQQLQRRPDERGISMPEVGEISREDEPNEPQPEPNGDLDSGTNNSDFFSQRSDYHRTMDPHNPSGKLEAELQALTRVQKIMEQDAANLDRLLQSLFVIGCMLFVALVWGAYQVYQSNLEDQRLKTLRRAVERKLLLNSVMSLQNRTSRRGASNRREAYTRSLLPTSRSVTDGKSRTIENGSKGRPSTPVQYLPDENKKRAPPSVGDDEMTKTPRTDNRSTSKRDTSHDRKPDSATKTEKSCTPATPPKDAARVTPSPQSVANVSKAQAPEDSRNPKQDESIGWRHLFSTSRVVSPPRPPRASESADDETESLSPCSKLAKEWAEKKELRRSNRKKKPEKLLPANSPSSDTKLSSRKLEEHVDSLVASIRIRPSIVPRPAAERAPVNQERVKLVPVAQTIKDERTIKPKAKLHPIAPPDPPSMGNRDRTPAKPPPIPELVCTTPGSEDSFIDDYW